MSRAICSIEASLRAYNSSFLRAEALGSGIADIKSNTYSATELDIALGCVLQALHIQSYICSQLAQSRFMTFHG